MTAAEIFDGLVPGASNDFALAVRLCQKTGPYCLIEGMAVNCYAEASVTFDGDFVVKLENLDPLRVELAALGFVIKEFPYTVNARLPGSKFAIQFSKSSFFADFPDRAVPKILYGETVMVASLPDLIASKLKSSQDPTRRASKKLKDLTDLARIAEAYPEYLPLMPTAIRKEVGSQLSDIPEYPSALPQTEDPK